ncbi:MAG: KEOPS complex subunit Cgi121 [Promethearchaeota archaeon]
MIIKKFFNPSLELQYCVGVSQINVDLKNFSKAIEIDSEKKILNYIFSICKKLEGLDNQTTIQFLKDDYLLNQDHLFTACYHVLKTFFHGINIANTKNLELLLYLSANRQINKALEAFGIDYDEIKSEKLTYCIISTKNDVLDISQELNSILKAKEIDISINEENQDKLLRIKQYFMITDEQINVVLNSYKKINNQQERDLSIKFKVVYDLICEKMSLLSTEKISLD